MNDKLYIKKFIRDDGQKLSFDGEQIYLAQENTLLIRPDPNTTAVSFTESDGGEMIRQQNNTYDQLINGIIIPKTTDYWSLTTQLSLFFKINHTYKIIYTKKDGTMFSISDAWISAGLQIVPVPHEEYSSWSITMTVGNVNWTEYAEDSQGNEIYSNNVTLPLLSAATGGEVWEDVSSTPVSKEGTSITFDNTVSGASITSLELKGDTYQQTYSGKNLARSVDSSNSGSGLTITLSNSKVVADGTATATRTIAFTSGYWPLPAGTYTLSANNPVANYSGAQIKIERENPAGDIEALAMNSVNASKTFTLSEETNVRIYARYGAGQYDNFEAMPQLESGNQPTSFEPYTGGIASPNPDYPQDVQVVTGEQTVTVSDGDNQSATYSVNLGKNLFDKDDAASIIDKMYINANSSTFALVGGSATAKTIYIPCLPNTTYTVSKNAGTRFIVATSIAVPQNGGQADNIITNNTAANITITTGANAKYLVAWVYNSTDTGTAQDMLDSVQIELGSQATTYAPYFTPIELCKIGTYQDYIYKSGDDWYVHKDCGKYVFTGSESWQTSAYGTNSWNLYNLLSFPFDTTKLQIMSEAFRGVPHDQRGSAGNNIIYVAGNNVFEIRNTGLTSQANVQSATNGTDLYYALATPTDTKITNQTLIGELEALAGADCYAGQTNFAVTAAGLLGVLAVEAMVISGGGEMWDSVGTVWELGSGGTQSINVDSTAVVYPVWVVEGPCVNPVLQNNTTDTIAQYDGTVASGQTLTVDFADGTAYLDSALVTRNVTGLVSMQPGENTVGFNSDGGTTDTSTISWNNIIN